MAFGFYRFAILSTLLVAAPAQAQEATPLRMGVIGNSARSISQLGLYIAQRRGFLERERIDLKIVPLPGVHHQIVELDKGNVDVSHTATPYLIQAVMAGSDSVAVVGGLANPVFAILARPEIKSLADLKGKTVGLSLPVDTITGTPWARTASTTSPSAASGRLRSSAAQKNLSGLLASSASAPARLSAVSTINPPIWRR